MEIFFQLSHFKPTIIIQSRIVWKTAGFLGTLLFGHFHGIQADSPPSRFVIPSARQIGCHKNGWNYLL